MSRSNNLRKLIFRFKQSQVLILMLSPAYVRGKIHLELEDYKQKRINKCEIMLLSLILMKTQLIMFRCYHFKKRMKVPRAILAYFMLTTFSIWVKYEKLCFLQFHVSFTYRENVGFSLSLLCLFFIKL